MAEVGLFAPDARVELIEGEIIDMAPIGDRHNAKVDWLSLQFNRAVVDDAIVRTQGSTRLGDMSMPHRNSRCWCHERISASAAGCRPRPSCSSWRPATALCASIATSRFPSTPVTAAPGVMYPVALPQVAIDLTDLFR
jgi:hypothetical protein